MAAAAAAERGVRTLLVEKNRKPGVKILMSGGTRCNITQATDNRGIVAAFGPPGPFPALGAGRTRRRARPSSCSSSEGVATKVEDTGKIFPASDKAADVLAALLRTARSAAARAGARRRRARHPARCRRLSLANHRARTLATPSLLITTGGQSYPGCGTTGDGYRWAAAFGHTIVPPRPALVPLTTNAAWVRPLQGITIPDVAVRVLERDGDDSSPRSKRPLAERRGSFLFTHFGLSGPVVLDVSRVVSGHPRPASLVLECDFLPGIARRCAGRPAARAARPPPARSNSSACCPTVAQAVGRSAA